MTDSNLRLSITIQEGQRKIDKCNCKLTDVRPMEIKDLFHFSGKDEYVIIVPERVYEWLTKTK
ncbi:hypothetical protein DRH27_02235 [Candidatus Falkowbacteria bacterium]|nr:MAG: hypothetical protein DRH27_02235 [Candidatus Falkowbacteria bacterium]